MSFPEWQGSNGESNPLELLQKGVLSDPSSHVHTPAL
jgi:hypothetical protein